MVKIVIVGGGFGGIYTTRYLQKVLNFRGYRTVPPKEVELTLISDKNYFLFTPMIHEVATGGLDPDLIIESIREITHKNVVFRSERVHTIELNRKQVFTDNATYDYDYLVIATGAKTWYLDENTYKHVYELKNVKDALKLKNGIISAFEKLPCDFSGKLNFVVAGGGPTGVELTCEVYEFIFNTILPLYSHLSKDSVEMSLICSSPALITYFSEYNQKKAYEYLTKLGIKIYLNTFITKIDEMGVYADGLFIETKNILWATGVLPSYPKLLGNYETNKSDRLVTTETLELKNYPQVYVVGDIAAGYPMLAYTATEQAKYVAGAIKAALAKKRVAPFIFFPRAKLISLGQKNALGEIYGVKISGKFVWFIWRTVYLTKIISFRKKVKIALNWTFNLFSPRDISKI